MEKEIKKAASIINAFFDSTIDADSAIPVEMIRNCAGVAFLTVVKAGFIWSGKIGTGLVISRLEDGSWSPPSGIGTAGVGFGAEIGGEIIDFMIILGSQQAVKTFKKGTQVSVGAGLDVAVGPVGRSAGANLNAGGGGLSGNYTYSHAKGAFVGVGLHGSTIMVRGDMNSRFYGREVSPMEILSGHVQPPTGSCDLLYEAIQRAMSNGTSANMYGHQPALSQPSYRHSSSSASSPSPTVHQPSSRSSFTAPSSSSSSPARSSSFRQSSSSSAPPAPIENDPRLRRFSQYKSERELYAQFEQQKKSGGGPANQYAGPAAAAASTASNYNAAPSSAANVYQQQASNGMAGASAPYASAGQAYQAQPVQQRPVKVTYVPASAYTPPSSTSSTTTSTPSRAPTPLPPIPSATTGAETKEVYTQVINFVSTRCPHASVQVFKDNCRRFGQDAMSLDAYFAYLSSICTNALMRELVPQLVRLLPTEDKREGLWRVYCRDILLIR